MDCSPPGSPVHGISHWSGLPLPPPGGLPNPEIEPSSPHWQADSLPLSHLGNYIKLVLCGARRITNAEPCQLPELSNLGDSLQVKFVKAEVLDVQTSSFQGKTRDLVLLLEWRGQGKRCIPFRLQVESSQLPDAGYLETWPSASRWGKYAVKPFPGRNWSWAVLPAPSALSPGE